MCAAIKIINVSWEAFGFARRQTEVGLEFGREYEHDGFELYSISGVPNVVFIFKNDKLGIKKEFKRAEDAVSEFIKFVWK